MVACPCGSEKNYAACCERYIKGIEIAPTAESLMRSRYSAYTFNNTTYLLASWHSTTRPENLQFDNEAPIKWLSLTINAIELGGQCDTEGMVEFTARYKINGKSERLHEKSRFIKENQRWFYVDGEIR